MTAETFLKVMKWDKESKLNSLPDWYGIPGIKFEFINTQADPHLWWKGKDIGSCYIVEDTMWERYGEWASENGIEFENEQQKIDMFDDHWMKDQAYEVYELCDLVLDGLREKED